MTGFIRGLFSRNKQPGNSGAFFLSDDDAKTFGDIDYMRSNKVVKRTFARKKGQEEMESVRQISAMDKREVDENGLASKSVPQQTSQSSTSAASAFDKARSFETPKFERRTSSKSSDDGMDMFRNMAKDIKRKR
ncbi:MAG: hypothetical protein AAFQ89_05530 [Cyanobacteria bacterium J06626_18]